MPCQFCAKIRKLFGINWLGVAARKLTNQPVLADLRIFISYCRGRFWIHNPKVVGSIPTVATKFFSNLQRSATSIKKPVCHFSASKMSINIWEIIISVCEFFEFISIVQ
jgi:hypothetical protein